MPLGDYTFIWHLMLVVFGPEHFTRNHKLEHRSDSQKGNWSCEVLSSNAESIAELR